MVPFEQAISHYHTNGLTSHHLWSRPSTLYERLSKESHSHEPKNRLALTHFQLVCKRFRSVALLVPYLWTYVDDRMSVDRITMQMSHRANYAGDMGFRISYNPSLAPTCKCGQWGLIRLHSSRWTNAYVEMTDVAGYSLYAW